MILYILVILTAISSLTYELLLATLWSYLLWDSVTVTSLTIWFFLFGLGIGAYSSSFLHQPKRSFLYCELLLGVVWWLSLPLVKRLYLLLYPHWLFFWIFFLLCIVVIGILSWMEAPLIARMIKNKSSSHLISNVFSLDYVGSLVATLLFPFLLLPIFWLLYTWLLLWGVTISFVCIYAIWYYRKASFSYMSLAVLFWYSSIAYIYAMYWDALWYDLYFNKPVITQVQTSYQDIVITKKWNQTQLFLDGHLQFSSNDEHRYHAALWNIPSQLDLCNKSCRILILGGGDGLLVKYILSQVWTGFQWSLTLVDLDPWMTNLARTNPVLRALNKWILDDNRVTIINEDAYTFVQKSVFRWETYDIIIADLPDPRSVSLKKLYGYEMYVFIDRLLRSDGLFVTQAGSAYVTKEAFGCIRQTISNVRWSWSFVYPYRAYIPSFGDWWFIAVTHNKSNIVFSGLVTDQFDSDYIRTWSCNNTMDSSDLIDLYLDGWRRHRMGE